MRIIINILLKRYESKYFFYEQGKNIEIQSIENLKWTIDGEYGGRTKNLKINVLNKAITFIIPK